MEFIESITVPARVCNLCDEAYLSPEIFRRIDEVMKEYFLKLVKLAISLPSVYFPHRSADLPKELNLYRPI